MNETMVTVVGHVATEPGMRTTTGGARVVNFRLASTERRFDKGVNGWRDAHTTFFTVTAWRTMAENVFSSVKKGQPVVVHGRLRDSSYEAKDGQWRTVLDVEAYALGHDMSRGVSEFKKGSLVSGVNIVPELEELEELDEVGAVEVEDLDGLGEVDLVTGEVRDPSIAGTVSAPSDDADPSEGGASDHAAPDPDPDGGDSLERVTTDTQRTRSGGRGRTTSAA